MSNPFGSQKLRDWLFQGVDATGMFPKGIGTLGSCPFDEYEFDAFLRTLGIEAFIPSADLNTMVIGRTEWENDLNDAIEARRGKELRVYSQEMFLAYILGNDPLESPAVAEVFGEGHPALEHIRDWGFEWPTTRLVPFATGSGIPATTKLKEESPLKILGYTAGALGRDRQERRNALSLAFTKDFRGMVDVDHLQWGEPQSGTRLRKIAERLAMNIDPLSRGGRRREAVRHWLEDLEWLKEEYYDGRHTFPWPSPLVT